MPTVYNKGIEELMKALTDLDGSSLVVLLMQSAYAFNPDHLFISDVSASELSVVGYSRQALANKVVTRDDANDQVVLTGDDVQWASLAAGQTVGGAILARTTGVDATSPLLGFTALTLTATNGGSGTLEWAAAGIMRGTSP